MFDNNTIKRSFYVVPSISSIMPSNFLDSTMLSGVLEVPRTYTTPYLKGKIKHSTSSKDYSALLGKISVEEKNNSRFVRAMLMPNVQDICQFRKYYFFGTCGSPLHFEVERISLWEKAIDFTQIQMGEDVRTILDNHFDLFYQNFTNEELYHQGKGRLLQLIFD
jgi:hypothetical protein